MRMLKVLLIVAVAILGGAAIGLRLSRGKVGTIEIVRPDLDTVTSAIGISLFAARTAPGPHVIFFDAGIDPKGAPVLALLTALGASPDDVTDVFLTHGHGDHLGGVPLLPKARVHLGAGDVPLAGGQVPPELLMPRLIGKLMGSPSIAVNAPITGAASFPVGATDPAKTVKAFPVPGHTPGSYVFLYDGVLLAGDIAIFKDGRLEAPPGIFDPHPEQSRASIISLKTQLANETVDIVCTAHGGCTPKGLGRVLLDDLIQRLGG